MVTKLIRYMNFNSQWVTIEKGTDIVVDMEPCEDTEALIAYYNGEHFYIGRDEFTILN